MKPLQESKLLEIGKKSSFVYLALRLIVIGTGFMMGSLIGQQLSILKPMCMSLCFTSLYMFIYLEIAMIRKNLEQCKSYWGIALLASLEACVVIETILKYSQGTYLLTFCIMYLVLCLCEFVRVYFICMEFGDMFEWFYFKHSGGCTVMKGKCRW